MLLLSIGCSAVPEIRYFDLARPLDAIPGDDGVDPQASAASPDDRRWAVAELAVDPPYDQDRLVYRQSPSSGEVGFYEFTRWAAPLGQLLQKELVRRLEAVKGLASVESQVNGRSYHRVLQGRVLQAEEVDLPDGSIVARLRLDLRLEDSDGGLCWHDEIGGEASGRARHGAEVMALFHGAADQLFDELGRRLEELRAAPTEGPGPTDCS